jgi:hypothetical protein
MHPFVNLLACNKEGVTSLAVNLLACNEILKYLFT